MPQGGHWRVGFITQLKIFLVIGKSLNPLDSMIGMIYKVVIPIWEKISGISKTNHPFLYFEATWIGYTLESCKTLGDVREVGLIGTMELESYALQKGYSSLVGHPFLESLMDRMTFNHISLQG